jgi:GNAT superfamily N-acetyltransferase
MIIRPINEGDIQDTVVLILRCWDEVMFAHHRADTIEKFRNEVNAEWLKMQMFWKDVFIVEVGGKIAATGAVANFGSADSPKICISQFFVDPDLHRQRVGSQLMEHLIQLVKARHQFKLHVPSSRNAVPFYQRFGFVIDSHQPDSADEITWMTMALQDHSPSPTSSA